MAIITYVCIQKLLFIASQMWTLGRLLPAMIGHLVPEDNAHWSHYLEVLDIMDLLFSPLVHPETPGYLEVLLEQNLDTFRRLYPGHSILPKMHFLVHTPHFLTRFVMIYITDLRIYVCMYVYIV